MLRGLHPGSHSLSEDEHILLHLSAGRELNDRENDPRPNGTGSGSLAPRSDISGRIASGSSERASDNQLSIVNDERVDKSIHSRAER